MRVSIISIRSAKQDEWDQIWQGCDYSTYFHSREWAEIWKIYTKGLMCPDPKLVLFSDGKKVLLPLSSQKGYMGLIKTYLSSPAGTFGGWISTDELSIKHAILLSEYLTKKVGNLIWRLNPYDPLADKAVLKIAKNDETHVLDLSEGFNNIFKKWTKGHASAVSKARREGVIARIASTLDDWKAYYQVYENSLQRWGEKATSVYGWELFNEMFCRNSQHIKLWVAIYRDEMVAGSLCFYAKKHVVYWHGAALKDYFQLRPVNLLIYEIIKDACNKGYRWFDFNPSGGHEGVKAFKKSFGTDERSSPVYVHESRLAKLINTGNSLIRRLL